MKSKFAIVFAMLFFVPIFGTLSAQARMDEAVKADMPFDFYAGTQKMPAGLYYLRFDYGSDVVELTNNSGNSVLLMGVEANDVTFQPTQLVFDRLGENYFLKTFETEGLDMDFSVKREEKTVAGNVVPTQVLVAMNHL